MIQKSDGAPTGLQLTSKSELLYPSVPAATASNRSFASRATPAKTFLSTRRWEELDQHATAFVFPGATSTVARGWPTTFDAFRVGRIRNGDASRKAPLEGRIDILQCIRGPDNDDSVALHTLEAIPLLQELRLEVAVHAFHISFQAERVHLVNVDDAGLQLPRQAEEGRDLLRRLPKPLRLDESRGDLQQRHAGLLRCRSDEHGLAATGRAVEQDARRWPEQWMPRPRIGRCVRLLHRMDHELLEQQLLILEAADVVKRRHQVLDVDDASQEAFLLAGVRYSPLTRRLALLLVGIVWLILQKLVRALGGKKINEVALRRSASPACCGRDRRRTCL
eukprot:scaffold1786_cov250-Pinguiococcus_pyrenoidosus.AAC.5